MALPYIMNLGNIRNPTSNCLRIRTVGTISESNGGKRNVLNTFYYMWNGGSGNPKPAQSQKAGLITTATTGFSDRVTALMVAALNVRYSLVSLKAKWVDNFLDGETIYTPSGYPLAGTVTGTGLPSNVAVCIEKLTGLASHHFHGSFHFRSASVSDAASTAGDEVSSTAITNFKTNLIPALSNNITDGTSTLQPFLFTNKLWVDPKFEERARGANAAAWEAELAEKYPGRVAGAFISSMVLRKQIGSFRKGQEKPTTYA